MNTKSDAAQANTPTPVTVERLRELQAKYRGGVERIEPIGARVVQWTELIAILDELLAARETISKLREAVPALERAAEKLHEHACECDHPTCDIPHDYKKLHSLAARMKS